MPFLTPETIVRASLGLLAREIVLPRLVFTDAQADFSGQVGDTITIRVPATATARDYEFRTRTAPIVVDELNETGVPLALDKHPYHATAVTDEQLSLDIRSFGEQVLAPQTRAVAERIEGYIAGAMTAATYATTVPFVEGTDDPYLVAVACRKALNKASVPFGGRTLLLGADVDAAFLASDKLVKVNESGSNSALREASLGRIAGFDVVTSNSIPATEAYAFHRTAFAFVSVAPVVPDGVTFGRGETYQGLGLRWIRDYDSNFMRDRSVVSAFAGATAIAEGGSVKRAVKIAFTPAV